MAANPASNKCDNGPDDVPDHSQIEPASAPKDQPQPLSYRDALEKLKAYTFLAVCLLFPLMPEEALMALADDIKNQGQQKLILRHHGKIADGRHRLAGCLIAGVEPKFEDWTGTEESLVHRVISENLHRRDLTSTQRAVIAYDLLPKLEADAKERQRLSQGKGEKVAKDSATLKGKASELAAAALQTNATYVEKIKKIAATTPELLEGIRSGVLSLEDAATFIRLSTDLCNAMLRECGGNWELLKQKIKEARKRAAKDEAAETVANNSDNTTDAHVIEAVDVVSASEIVQDAEGGGTADDADDDHAHTDPDPPAEPLVTVEAEPSAVEPSLKEHLATARTELEKAVQRRAEAFQTLQEHDGQDDFGALFKVYEAAQLKEAKRKRQVKVLEAQEKRERTIEEDSNALHELLAEADAVLKAALLIVERLKKNCESDRYEEHVQGIWESAESLLHELK